PVKAFVGHVVWLRDRCDAVLIQRLVSIRNEGRRRFGCPKAICLPDLMRDVVPGPPRILELLVDDRCRSDSRTALLRFGRLINPDHRGPQALEAGLRQQARIDQMLRAGMPLAQIWKLNIGTREVRGEDTSKVQSSGGRTRIGVVGHPYLLFDRYLSQGLVSRLESLDVAVRFTTGLPERAAFPEPSRSREICWFYEHELLGGAWYLLSQRLVDGLLLVSSFACGTAAVVNEIISRELTQFQIPIMTILLDEHTAEAGLLTRLEAFVELVRHNSSHKP
ncbi:MAG: acyl-CoA dehydratase activase-related protein, partial [candidate division WOR-3 bacterium]